MYAEFADVYDELMDDFDYPAWAAYYANLIRVRKPDAVNICECACGTGSLSVLLAKEGFRVTAIDLSPAMLRHAAEKARRAGVPIRFAAEDMCALALPRPADAIVAACDGVNYLTDMTRVAVFFAAAARALKPGGVLAFDISTRHKLEDVTGDNFFGEDRDNVTYLWTNALDRAHHRIDMSLTFFVREADGRYRRFDEKHTQRAHSTEELTQALAAAGFIDICVFGDRTETAPAADEMRVHICAVRGADASVE